LSRQTFHCDRTELDLRLMHLAVDEGVEIVPERVTGVDRDHDVITGLTTDGRTHIRAAWFVDATGHSCRLFGRALDLDLEALGAPRAAFWTRLREPPDGHATRLYFPEADADDLTWAWEIPLNADEVSVGLVMSVAKVTRLRHRGLRPREILEHQLAAIPSLGRVLGAHPDVGLHATAYTPYRHRRTLGPNWILVGDAASMVDPLTSNGVTSALRHAEQAARTVSNARDHDKLGRRHGWAYRNTAPSAVRTLDRAIEAFLYDPGVRRRVGLRWAVNLYAATGVITNSLYARINPATPRRAVVCAGMLAVSRLWIRAASTMLSGRAPAGARRQPQIGPRPTRRPQLPSARRPASRRPRRRSRLGRGLHTRQGHRGRPSWSPGSPRFETRAHGEGGTRGTGS
jgi:flavin-dependent dehydrogenase